MTIYFAPLSRNCATFISYEKGPCAAITCDKGMPAFVHASKEGSEGSTLAHTRSGDNPYSDSSLAPVVKNTFPSRACKYSPASFVLET